MELLVIFGVIKGAKCFETAHHMVLEQALAARAEQPSIAVALPLNLNEVIRLSASAAKDRLEGQPVPPPGSIDAAVLRRLAKSLTTPILWLELPDGADGGPLPLIYGLSQASARRSTRSCTSRPIHAGANRISAATISRTSRPTKVRLRAHAPCCTLCVCSAWHAVALLGLLLLPLLPVYTPDDESSGRAIRPHSDDRTASCTIFLPGTGEARRAHTHTRRGTALAGHHLTVLPNGADPCSAKGVNAGVEQC